MKDFEEKMAELLEVDLVKAEDVLEDFEAWDSLTSLSIIAFIDEEYHMSISAQQLLTSKTIGGLKNLVAEHK